MVTIPLNDRHVRSMFTAFDLGSSSRQSLIRALDS
jgi:hypothetical protein